MQNRLLVILAILAALIVGFLFYKSSTDATWLPADGTPIDIMQDPVQIADTSTILPQIVIHGSHYFAKVQASYTLRGMLVSKHKYPTGPMDEVARYDYAIIWGKVPDWLQYVKFTQSLRYCLYNYQLSTPVDAAYLSLHMSNNHLVVPNKNIYNALATAHKGDLIEIDGYLVNILANLKRRGTTNWNTSLTREDTGNGACEVLYVKKLRIADRIYE
jgi:hypothetical protein